MSLSIDEDRPDQPDKSPSPTAVKQGDAKPFWRRPWIIPLWLATAAFLYLQAVPFAGTPEAEAPIPAHDGFPAYYPLLLTHIGLSTVAIVTCCLQVWPWLRRRYPAVHRISGRIYVPSAVIGGLLGLAILGFAPVVGQVGAFMSTSLWVITTLVGFWAVRTGRYALHRRFMLYSFALVMNNLWGRAMAEVIFGFGIEMDFTYLGEAARWVGWVVNLMLVQWFLYRTAERPVEGPARGLVRD
ncbi:DUF2306 domain-containing protein [Streptosporangium sp. NBC_01756]|uniref:DUF2306 domain-containing protein n=1 Tax=Streptosporangium sp. NBC_01756 TaxID=2975950 RepID=UPI002DD97445|nr:DUF2306 domain-containing protein [Streptosporangium sp. NBC_01756]WSC85387.1 DUF2306 domain-containing protein [Streptosporangium sp. NBC_01756]